MTRQIDIINDPKYVPLHEHGFVGLIDTMGSDSAIVEAARVSYGTGTKTVNEDRGLIRYLIRHKHTSPIEMCEVKLHLKMPIFIMRQWVRHRTASLNEYSGRYSVMSDEMYVPAPDYLAPQSQTNKQGRGGDLTDVEKQGITWLVNASHEHSYDVYEALRKKADEWGEDDLRNVIYDVYAPKADAEHEMDGYFDEDYPGLTRELARIVMPLSNYTELYWKQNLHNMMHLIKLRRDSHAQREIRDYAEAVFGLIKPKFPFALEAWEDYVWEAETLSRMEVSLMQSLLSANCNATLRLETMLVECGGADNFIKKHGFSKREFSDFRSKWKV